MSGGHVEQRRNPSRTFARGFDLNITFANSFLLLSYVRLRSGETDE